MNVFMNTIFKLNFVPFQIQVLVIIVGFPFCELRLVSMSYGCFQSYCHVFVVKVVCLYAFILELLECLFVVASWVLMYGTHSYYIAMVFVV